MSRQAIFEASVHYFFEPIAHLLDDESVRKSWSTATTTSTSSGSGKLERTDVRFPSDDALLSAIHNVAQWVGREISEEHPVLDARLPDGSRVHAVIPPSARTGIYLTIRKFTREVLTLDDLIGFGSLSEAAKEFIEICVRLRKNIMISGGTGTGKTVLVGGRFAGDSRGRADHRHRRHVGTAADPGALPVPGGPARRPRAAAGGLNVRQLFVNSLRMRPDRIIVGEVRGGEALDMIQSMISGHAGALSTDPRQHAAWTP